ITLGVADLTRAKVTGFGWGLLDVNLHAGRVDVAARVGLTSLIDERGARPVGSIGLGVTVHWDHPAAGAGGCPPCPGEGGS
ncbi:MAG: LysR family transcriptional regulator, partial [Myxococcales bacterium]|nr:LysR family transcriptional regulator [Myxococcales bacterium]